MLNKKTFTLALLSAVLAFNSINLCQAAEEQSKETKNELTMEISVPEQVPNLAPNERPNPVFLQITMNNGSAPVYSAPVFPGDTKPVILKVVAPSANGAQIQFVASTGDNIQPLSFVYSFAESRLTCLIDHNAKIQVFYSITTKMLDVKGIPATC